ncbi:MAG: NAD(P)H-dependent oxidoreductase subunit E [Gemmatimonadaceae bacterium]
MTAPNSTPEYFRAPAEWSPSDGKGFQTDSGHGHHEHHEYVAVLTAGSARRKELDELMTRYPTKMALVLPALWMVQHERGWVSPEGMAEVAEVLELTPAYVKGVVTFYTMYHQHPVGRHLIQVCTTTPCNVCGADAVVDALLRATGCQELGQPSPDGKFTVIEVECLGACGFATPIMINEDFIESVTPDNVSEILATRQ